MRRLVLFLFAAALAALLYLEVAHRRPPRIPETFTPAAASPVDAKEIPGLTSLDAEYTKLVDAVVPSVVSITSTATVRVPVADLQDYARGRWLGRYRENTQSSLGSGVIVSAEGHILTNHHVIENMQQIQVQLTDGRTLPAVLIGSDPSVDIAVLRIDLKNAPALPLANSDEVRVGQMVFAVGNPFGLQETVTRGILSAKGRALRDSGVEFFQTDAAVNPGNSGGPLLNVRGQIIGINSAIYSQSGSFAGISFAIPSNVAERSLKSILKMGHPTRGYLGVSMISLNAALARQAGVGVTEGVLVADVAAGSPAEEAGLKPGDVIRTFNGHELSGAPALRDFIAQAGVGAKVKLGIVRGDQEHEVAIAVVEAPTESMPATPKRVPALNGPSAKAEPTPAPAEPQGTVLAGLKVGEIPQPVREVLPANVQGVMVEEVDPNAPAASQLHAGDIIQMVGQVPLHGVEDYQALVPQVPARKPLRLTIIRGRIQRSVLLEP